MFVFRLVLTTHHPFMNFLVLSCVWGCLLKTSYTVQCIISVLYVKVYRGSGVGTVAAMTATLFYQSCYFNNDCCSSSYYVYMYVP